MFIRHVLSILCPTPLVRNLVTSEDISIFSCNYLLKCTSVCVKSPVVFHHLQGGFIIRYAKFGELSQIPSLVPKLSLLRRGELGNKFALCPCSWFQIHPLSVSYKGQRVAIVLAPILAKSIQYHTKPILITLYVDFITGCK